MDDDHVGAKEGNNTNSKRILKSVSTSILERSLSLATIISARRGVVGGSSAVNSRQRQQKQYQHHQHLQQEQQQQQQQQHDHIHLQHSSTTTTTCGVYTQSQQQQQQQQQQSSVTCSDASTAFDSEVALYLSELAGPNSNSMQQQQQQQQQTNGQEQQQQQHGQDKSKVLASLKAAIQRAQALHDSIANETGQDQAHSPIRSKGYTALGQSSKDGTGLMMEWRHHQYRPEGTSDLQRYEGVLSREKGLVASHGMGRVSEGIGAKEKGGGGGGGGAGTGVGVGSEHYNHGHGNMTAAAMNMHAQTCPAIEMLMRSAAQSRQARQMEEHRNMTRTKWAAILYTVLSTVGILFACALDEKVTDRITFVVMYVLGMIVPIYALVDYCITRAQSDTKIVDEQAAFVYHI
ncbi:hypothetical protein BGZ94_002514 [Podila epigama]|nr:hypothetical protein BGZ94_002514 [Podila epigama]